MKYFISIFAVAIIIFSTSKVQSQDLNFRDSVYFYRGTNDTLITSGQNLGAFNFSSANRATDSLFHDGIYFPSSDCFGRNLWIRIRHVSEDPNGISVGVNVPSTVGNPCQGPTMLGGWAGFLYDIEIHQDINLTGSRTNHLGGLFPTSITVASLEWLGGPCNWNEWLCFKILNSGSTGWSLNSINFTGVNPQSDPVFSDSLAVYVSGGCYPPDGFSYTFPTGADSVSATSGAQTGSGLSEFKMSAGSVSHFQYGYEYTGLSGGYQGMSMAFGSAPTFTVTPVDVSCGNGNDGEMQVVINGGIGPFTYNWTNGVTTGDTLAGLSSGTYLLTVTDQNGCGTIAPATVTINEPLNVTITLDSTHVTNVQCHNGMDGSFEVFTVGTAPVTYLWNTSSTMSSISGVPAGLYMVTITNMNSCYVVYDTITEPAGLDTSTTLNGFTITSNETGATYQWINCNGNTIITDSTFASFTPSSSGYYKVAITKNGCTDTSACVHISLLGLQDVNALSFSVYPNPAKGLISFVFTKPVVNAGLKIINEMGQIVLEQSGINGDMYSIDLSKQVNGIYIAELVDNGIISRIQLVKN